MRSADRFKNFLVSDKRVRLLIVIAACAALLIVLGGSGAEDSRDGAPSQEERTEQICSMVEGVGECEVMISYDEGGSVYAVAVLCDGAESYEVKTDLSELLSSLFGIGANRISVLKISK